MNNDNDLEKATKAAQCADLLCQDLKALAATDNLILSDVVMKELEIAAAMRIRLERLASNLESQEKQSSMEPLEIPAFLRKHGD